MNDTATASSAPADSLLPSGIGAITALHFVFMALVALLAIGILVYGIRRKRMRDKASEQVVEHADAAGIPAAEDAEEPEPAVPTPPSPAAPPPPSPFASSPAVPVAPAPPPLSPDPLHDEPVVAAAPLDASPAALAADAPAEATERGAIPADGPVTALKGLGPKVASRLAELGITSVGQIAALTDAEAEALDADLGAFRGRMARDRWIEQARFLAAGDRAGFEAVFGRL